MKKYFLSNLVIAALIISAAFVSCKKDDDGPASGSVSSITATVENPSKYADVKQVAMKVNDYRTDSKDVIKTVPFTGGSFTIDLSTLSVPAKYLIEIGNDMPSTISVSNTSAKIAMWFDFIGIDDEGEEVTEFWLGKEDATSEFGVSYWYSNSDVTITGTEKESGEDWEDNYTYSLNIKNGWNTVYSTWTDGGTKDGKEVYNAKISTNSVGGLKWYGWRD